MSIRIVGYVFIVTAIACILAYRAWSKKANR